MSSIDLVILGILLKDRIEFFQWKIQSVDITPDQENADIFKLIVSI